MSYPAGRDACAPPRRGNSSTLGFLPSTARVQGRPLRQVSAASGDLSRETRQTTRFSGSTSPNFIRLSIRNPSAVRCIPIATPRQIGGGVNREGQREFERLGREGDANAGGSRRSPMGPTQTENAAASATPRLTPESPPFPPPRPDAGNRPGRKAKPARFRGPGRDVGLTRVARRPAFPGAPVPAGRPGVAGRHTGLRA